MVLSIISFEWSSYYEIKLYYHFPTLPSLLIDKKRISKTFSIKWNGSFDGIIHRSNLYRDLTAWNNVAKYTRQTWGTLGLGSFSAWRSNHREIANSTLAIILTKLRPRIKSLSVKLFDQSLWYTNLDVHVYTYDNTRCNVF